MTSIFRYVLFFQEYRRYEYDSKAGTMTRIGDAWSIDVRNTMFEEYTIIVVQFQRHDRHIDIGSAHISSLLYSRICLFTKQVFFLHFHRREPEPLKII